MANIDVGGGSHGKRSLNLEVPLIPFIDFLLCLVAFLLVTAVWSHMARLDANAKVPGPPDSTEPQKRELDWELHVEMRAEKGFQLVWKEGNTVVSSVSVESRRVPSGSDGDYGFPALAEQNREGLEHLRRPSRAVGSEARSSGASRGQHGSLLRSHCRHRRGK
ncbi:MAG: biopolymer transporter ExbD [Polyangiaceae bacterium]